MDLTQITTLLALSLAVRGDYSGSSSYSAPPSSSYGAPSSSYNAPSTNYGAPVPSTSYGAPSYDHGDHHGPVKRHVRGGGCCQSSGGWYNGGSSGVRPGQHSSGGCCSQNPRPPSPCGHQGCGASQPQPQTYAHPQPQPQTYAHPQPQPQTYAHPHPQPQTYAHPQHQPQTYAHPQPQPQTYAPPQPQRYSPPPQPQHSPSPAPSYHQPSPRISQPPPYPLPSGPPGGQHAPGRPDYLPRYAGGYGGYGLSTRPYNFGYNVRDYHTGADFKQQETSDGNTVKGQYRVQLPDGRTQIVTYTADWQTGFHADVQYEGEASYPAVYGTGGSFPPSTASSYGVPSQPSSSYGVPSHSSSSWNSQPSGGSYQSRVGGTGNQYLNIGHAPAGGASHGHPGYRK